MKTQYLCFPLNTKPTTTTTTNSSTSTSSPTTNVRVPPPSSLLDRFRDAVFRLIMATALSKNNHNNKNSSSSSNNNHSDNYYRNNSNVGQESVRRSCYLYDPYHSEALADCIEFIKNSAKSSPSDHHSRLHHDLDDDEIQYHYDDHDHDHDITRDSTVSSDVVIPLPVM